MIFVLSLVGGYLIGSIPTAYLVVKKQMGIDIRESGSGNVGGLNAFRVTESKSVGYVVGVLDGLKGVVTVLVAGLVLGSAFWPKAVALFGAVIGHNYPVWLGFKGGRGLSTACGGLFLLGVSYIVVWCTMWVVLFRLRRDILWANLVCTIATPVILWATPKSAIEGTIFSSGEVGEYLWFSIALSLLLLASHVDEIQKILKFHGRQE